MIISSQLKIFTMITTSTRLKRVIPGSLSWKKLFVSIIIAVSAMQAFGQANTALSNLSATAVNVNLLPGLNNSKDLGSSGRSWKDLYISGTVFMNGFPFLSMTNLDNTCVGNYAGHTLSTAANGNTFAGYNSGYYNSSGDYNSAFGDASLKNNSTGWYNAAFGYTALYSNTTGTRNSALGSWTLHANTTGNDNAAFGYYTLYDNETGFSNAAFGNYALTDNTAGYDNSAFGYYALSSNSTGHDNAATGIQALNFNTTGSFNTASGRNALFQNTVGSNNTAIGYGAGGNNDNDTYCSFLGYDADQSVLTDFSNSTAVGNSARITASNQVRIGNSSITSIGGYAGWSNLSDGRYKKDVRENVPGLDFINKLKPVTYHLDVTGLKSFLGEDKNDDEVNAESSSISIEAANSKAQILYSGFIAQEVEKTAKEMGYDFSGVDAPKNENDLYGLRYAEFVVPLVKSVQELSVKNDELSAANESLQLMVSHLAAQLVGQQHKLEKLESQVAELLSSGTGLNDGAAKISMADENILPLLGQNIPNPFDNSTVIPFRIPKGCTSASIVISEFASGRMITVIPVSCNETHAMIEAGALASGSYIYSLYVDGKIIDTKKMELLK
jgi:hypothetical protein